NGLRRNLADMSQTIAGSRRRAEEAAALTPDRKAVETGIQALQETPFIAKDFADGTFVRRVAELDGGINALRKYSHPLTPAEWLGSLGALDSTSPRLREFWEQRKRAIRQTVGDMDRDRALFLRTKFAVERVARALAELDKAVPAPPPGLAPAFQAAAV